MKEPTRRIIVGLVFVWGIVNLSFAQPGSVQWEWMNGPWAAQRVRQFAIGYAGSTPVIYAAQESVLVKSTNDGESWQRIESIMNATTVACERDNPHVVYVGFSGSGIKKSTDGGQTWNSVNSGLGNQKITRLAISPFDNTRLLAGAERYGAPPPATLWESTNGGQAWAANSYFLSQNIMITISDIEFSPVRGDWIYVSGSDGPSNQIGVWRSRDGGATWRWITNGMDNKQIGAMTVKPEDDSVLVAASRSPSPRVYKTTDAGENWSTVIEVDQQARFDEVIFSRGRHGTDVLTHHEP